jgi:hypothetical protein
VLPFTNHGRTGCGEKKDKMGGSGPRARQRVEGKGSKPVLSRKYDTGENNFHEMHSRLNLFALKYN